MSVQAMFWALKVKTNTPTQKLILLLLADRANDKGTCFPSMSTIAKDACVSRGCVIENVKKLSALGFIDVKNRTIKNAETGTNRQTSNLYKLNLGSHLKVQGVVIEDDRGSHRGLQGVVIEDDTINLPIEPTIETGTAMDEKEFEQVWILYQRKGNKQTALRYWKKLSQKDKEAIKAKIPSYVNTTPELRFRKDFQGWINPSNRIWENQIVPNEQTSVEKEEDFSDYKL